MDTVKFMFRTVLQLLIGSLAGAALAGAVSAAAVPLFVTEDCAPLEDQTADTDHCTLHVIHAKNEEAGDCTDPDGGKCKFEDITGSVGIWCPTGSVKVQFESETPVSFTTMPFTISFGNSGNPVEPPCGDASGITIEFRTLDSSGDKTGEVQKRFYCSSCP